jgi:hypothetical protein
MKATEISKLEWEQKLADVNAKLDTTETAKFHERMNQLEDALSSDEAFENYVKTYHQDDLVNWDKKNQNSAHVGQYVIDTRQDVPDAVKKVAKELRGFFHQIGSDEVKIGKLSQSQFDNMINHYLTHVMTDDGEKFFKENTIHWDKNGKIKVTPRGKGNDGVFVSDEYGFGQKWNPYQETRKLRGIVVNGVKIAEPTVRQLNEFLRPLLKDKNAFNENIAEIFMARALKHNELMYDYKYTHNMLEEVGENLPKGVFTASKGNHVVMNYGMFQNSLHDMASLNNALHVSEAVGEYVRSTVLPQVAHLQGVQKNEAISRMVEDFVNQHFPAEKMKENYDFFHEQVFNILGINKNTFHEIAVPLVQLKANQVKDLMGHFQLTRDAFEEMVKKQEQNLVKYGGAQDVVDRVMRNRKKLDELNPLQIKQVDSVIVDKANQARTIQMAKNQKMLIRNYDKFLHWTKLAQTTVMPSFHARNFMSNKYLGWLSVGNDIFDWEMNKAVFHAIKNFDDLGKLKDLKPIVTSDGRVYDWSEIFDLAHANNVINEGFFAKDLGADTASKGFINPLKEVKIRGKKYNLDFTDTENFAWFKKGTEVGNKIENYDRLLQFASHLKQGKSVKEAKNLVDKYLFDYSDLTNFERTVMKRIFPFYTWIRKNGALQLTNWMENPKKYANVQKMLNGVSGMTDDKNKVERQYLAPFARDWVQTPFNYTNKTDPVPLKDKKGNPVIDKNGNPVMTKSKTTKEPILWNPNLPYMDLGRIPDPTSLVNTAENLIPQMSTAIKAPLELGTSHNFFFNCINPATLIKFQSDFCFILINIIKWIYINCNLTYIFCCRTTTAIRTSTDNDINCCT